VNRAALLVLLLAPPALAAAATHHVAPGGDDRAAGDEAHPWQTLQHAADTVGAGDVVEVAPGDYRGFDLRASGTENAPIVFHGGAGVRLTQDNPVTPDGVNVEDASWVVIDGFEASGRTRTGFRAAVCSHVTLRNLHGDANGRWGILTGHCDDLLIEDCEMSRSVAEHGIYVSNSGDRPVIRRNHVWGNHANGIHMNGDESQGGDGIITGALVEANVIHGNGAAGGSGINCDGVQDSTFRNNVLFDDHGSGISLYQIDAGGPSTGNLVINNTIVQAEDGRWAVNLQDAATGNTVLNDVLLSLHPFRGAIDASADSLPGLHSDHNVVIDRFSPDDDAVMDLATWRAQTGQDAHSIAAELGQVIVSAIDLHLVAGSPAIDAGTSDRAPPDDVEGTRRPQGRAVDAGAYELGAPGGSGGSGGGSGSGGAGGTPAAGGSGGRSCQDDGSCPPTGPGYIDEITGDPGCGCDAGTPGALSLLALLALSAPGARSRRARRPSRRA
jgi:hypothetical protein